MTVCGECRVWRGHEKTCSKGMAELKAQEARRSKWRSMPQTPTGTKVVGDEGFRVTVELPADKSWHGDDGERRFLTMTPEVAADLMHALEWWKDER